MANKHACERTKENSVWAVDCASADLKCSRPPERMVDVRSVIHNKPRIGSDQTSERSIWSIFSNAICEQVNSDDGNEKRAPVHRNRRLVDAGENGIAVQLVGQSECLKRKRPNERPETVEVARQRCRGRADLARKCGKRR